MANNNEKPAILGLMQEEQVSEEEYNQSKNPFNAEDIDGLAEHLVSNGWPPGIISDLRDQVKADPKVGDLLWAFSQRYRDVRDGKVKPTFVNEAPKQGNNDA